MPAHITIQDLAAMLAVSPKTIYQWRWRGIAPPAITIGNTVRFERNSVDRWLTAHEDKDKVDQPAPSSST